MKPLAIWVAVVAVVLGGYAVVTSLLQDTSRVFVVVDSSFPMAEVWSQVPGELDDLDDEDHAEFALVTEKRPIHSWQSELALGGVEPFAPCTFDGIADHPEVADADELVLVTTAASCDTSALTGWRIVTLTP